MSIPRTPACILVVVLTVGAFIPKTQAQASNSMPSCNLGGPPALPVGFTDLKRKSENYKEAGKPGHDPIILRIAPNDIG